MEVTYDAWGNFTDTVSTYQGVPSTEQLQVLAMPFRYRGYVYDQETELYYLNTRYYDAKTCRFINADSYVSTGQGLLGANMYAYCGNNPVMYSDPSGELFFLWLTKKVSDAMLFVASVNSMANAHYSRNELNKPTESIEEIMNTYEKQSESMDNLHEYTDGAQGEDAIYNDKYLSPNGGHYEVIICDPPDKDPYIVDETVDPTNMGTYNYASNDAPKVCYGLHHLFADILPWVFCGNTKEDSKGVFKWLIV